MPTVTSIDNKGRLELSSHASQIVYRLVSLLVYRPLVSYFNIAISNKINSILLYSFSSNCHIPVLLLYSIISVISCRRYFVTVNLHFSTYRHMSESDDESISAIVIHTLVTQFILLLACAQDNSRSCQRSNMKSSGKGHIGLTWK